MPEKQQLLSRKLTMRRLLAHAAGTAALVFEVACGSPASRDQTPRPPLAGPVAPRPPEATPTPTEDEQIIRDAAKVFAKEKNIHPSETERTKLLQLRQTWQQPVPPETSEMDRETIAHLRLTILGMFMHSSPNPSYNEGETITKPPHVTFFVDQLTTNNPLSGQPHGNIVTTVFSAKRLTDGSTQPDEIASRLAGIFGYSQVIWRGSTILEAISANDKAQKEALLYEVALTGLLPNDRQRLIDVANQLQREQRLPSPQIPTPQRTPTAGR